MKYVVILIIFLFSFTNSIGQDISDVSESNNGKLTVLNSQNQEISYKYLHSGDELSGFSQYIIVTKSKDGKVIVYDQDLRQISYKYLYEGDSVKNVSGSNIIIRRKDGKIITYNKNFDEVSYRYE